MARKIKQDGLRVKVLVGLLGQLNGNEKEQVMAEAIYSSAKIEQAQLRGEVLAALAPHLTGSLLAEALSIVKELRFGGERARALCRRGNHVLCGNTGLWNRNCWG